MPRAQKRPPLTAEDLEALGAARLAGILVEIADDDRAVRRRLELAVAGDRGADAAAGEIRKQISTLRRGRAFVFGGGVRQLAHQVEATLDAIREHVSPTDPALALELLLLELESSDRLFERVDDSDGFLGDAFSFVRSELGRVAAAAQVDVPALARRAVERVMDNGYGQYDDLLTHLAPALGEAGLALVEEGVAARVAAVPADDYAVSTARLVRMELADIRGDVDAYVAQYDEETRRRPRVATEIAQRMLAAGRAEEALQALDAVDAEGRRWGRQEYDDARIRVLDALGRKDDAQALRWHCFESYLSESDLREYLRRDPGFDGVEVENRALDHALSHPSFGAALSFLLSWPDIDRAAALVRDRRAELNGADYVSLPRAAGLLAERHPLAATLALRALVDFSLDGGRSTRYRHAARHLKECAALAPSVDDFGDAPAHDAWVASLRERHGRKSSFWKRVD